MDIDRQTIVEPLLLSAGEAATLCGVSKSLWRAEELRAWVTGGCPSRAKWLQIGGTQ